MFDLHLLSAAEPQHDATTANGQTGVQIKLAVWENSVTTRSGSPSTQARPYSSSQF